MDDLLTTSILDLAGSMVIFIFMSTNRRKSTRKTKEEKEEDEDEVKTVI